MITFSATNFRRVLYIFLLCCLTSIQLRAQPPGILPATPKLPDAVQGQAYPAPYTGKTPPPLFKFSISDGQVPSSWEWIPLDGTDNITDYQMRINNSGELEGTLGPGSIPVIPSGAMGICRGRVKAFNNVPALINERDYTLVMRNGVPPLCTQPKEYVLLLDRSGSMNIGVSGGGSRWDELTNTVATYLPQLNDALGRTGSLKVYYFNGASASLKYTGNWGADWSNRTFIEETLFQEGTPLADITPSGGTPMGDAICDAIQGSTATSNRTFILFTDGIQTVPPDYSMGTHNTPCTSGGAIDLDNSPHNQIKLFTIGTGGCDVALLHELANPNDQFAQANIGGSPELNIFFTSTIPWSLYDCGSPRLIDYRAGVMGGGNDTISQKFKVNKLVDNLAIRLTYFPDRSIAIFGPAARLYKDGEQVPYEPIIGNNTIRYFIEFSDPYEAGGEWELRFTGPTYPYELSVMAEDKYIKTKLSAGQDGLVYAGDPINVQVSVINAGAGVNDATVRAILLRPGEDLGDLAARTNISAGSLATSVGSDPVDIGQIGRAHV